MHNSKGQFKFLFHFKILIVSNSHVLEWCRPVKLKFRGNNTFILGINTFIAGIETRNERQVRNNIKSRKYILFEVLLMATLNLSLGLSLERILPMRC